MAATIGSFFDVAKRAKLLEDLRVAGCGVESEGSSEDLVEPLVHSGGDVGMVVLSVDRLTGVVLQISEPIPFGTQNTGLQESVGIRELGRVNRRNGSERAPRLAQAALRGLRW